MATFAGHRRPGRLRPGPDADVRGDRGVPAGRRGHRRRPQGDVRLRRQGRPPHRAAPRGHGVGRPGLRPAPPADAVEGLVRRRRASATSGPRPAATASTTRSASRRSAPPTPTSTSRSSPCWPTSTAPLGLRQVDLAPQLDRRRRPTGPRYIERAARRSSPATSTSSPPTTARRSTPTRCGCSTPSGPRARRWSPTRPLLLDDLSAEAAAHFDRVQAGLDALGIALPHRAPPRARASTTTRTPRSSSRASALDGAQNTIGGGGRYDGLVESLGGPPTPGIGFGSGIERVLATCDAEGVFDAAGRGARRVRGRRDRRRRRRRDLTLELRRAGMAADRAFERRARRSMKVADEGGRPVGRRASCVIVGERRAGRRHRHRARPARPTPAQAAVRPAPIVVDQIRRPTTHRDEDLP